MRSHHQNKKSPSGLGHSRKRHAHFLEKKLAGKPDLASPEDQQDSDNSVSVKELENTSLICGSNRDLVSSESPTATLAAESDLFYELAILLEFLDKTNIDSKDSRPVYYMYYVLGVFSELLC